MDTNDYDYKINKDNFYLKNSTNRLNINSLYFHSLIDEIDKCLIELKIKPRGIFKYDLWDGIPIALKSYINNCKWDIYPIDLAIYIEDIESLEVLLKNGAKDFIDNNGFINLCIKERSKFVFSSPLFPLLNLIENNLISLIINIVVNDFSFGFKNVFESKNNNQEFLAFAFCLSVDYNSQHIFNYILDQIDTQSYLIAPLSGDFGIGGRLCPKDHLPRVYYKHGIERFRFVTSNDLPEFNWNYKTVNIYTPLQYVCRNGNKAMVNSLLNKKAPINEVYDNMTALDFLLEDDVIQRYSNSSNDMGNLKRDKDEIKSLLLEYGAISGKAR